MVTYFLFLNDGLSAFTQFQSLSHITALSKAIASTETFGEKHAQQFLEDSGQGSEQAACHASAQRRVCLLPSDVILSEAKDLARGAQRCFAALSMTARTAVKAAQVRSQEKSYLQMSI